MSYKRIAIFVIALLFIGFFIFFSLYKNLEINNPSGAEVFLNGRSLGKERRIKTGTPFGKEIYIRANQYYYKYEPYSLKDFVQIPAESQTKPDSFEAEEMTPSVISPFVQDEKIIYLGGRTPWAIFSYDPTQAKRVAISERNLRGAEDIIWSPNKKMGLLKINRDGPLDQQFQRSEATIWLFNTEGLKSQPTNFDSAVFTDNKNILGIVKDKIYNFDGERYEEIKTIKGNFSNKKILSSNKTVVLYDLGSISIFNKNGKKYFSKSDGRIGEVAISDSGQNIIFNIERGGQNNTVTYQIDKKKLRPIPVAMREFTYKNNDEIAAIDYDSNIWTINTKNVDGQKIFTDRLAYNIFCNGNDIYYQTLGKLKKILF